MKNTFFTIIFIFVLTHTVSAQKKIMDFYFEGGKVITTEEMIDVVLDGENIHTDQAVLTYIKNENSMRLDFVDDNLKPYSDELENLDAYVVKGKTEIVWRHKKDQKLEVIVYEDAGVLFFKWKGKKYRLD